MVYVTGYMAIMCLMVSLTPIIIVTEITLYEYEFFFKQSCYRYTFI